MKYRARFADEEKAREVEITDDTREPYLALDGVPAVYDVVHLGPGRYSLIAPDGRHAEASVRRAEDGSLRVQVGAEVRSVELLDELTARALAAAGKGRARHASDLKAAIPGRVLRVLVAEGEVVEAGKTLVVLEAMKMENEVRAPRAGRIRAIDVAAGQAVGAGDVLVRFSDD
jgi:biotin carboxyl carrier protein